jgi:hypothetical protein
MTTPIASERDAHLAQLDNVKAEARTSDTGPLLAMLVLAIIGVLCTFWGGTEVNRGATMVEVGIPAVLGILATWLGTAIAFKLVKDGPRGHGEKHDHA